MARSRTSAGRDRATSGGREAIELLIQLVGASGGRGKEEGAAEELSEAQSHGGGGGGGALRGSEPWGRRERGGGGALKAAARTLVRRKAVASRGRVRRLGGKGWWGGALGFHNIYIYKSIGLD